MPNPSVFTEEWRDCLRAHYTQVVRNQDALTERSLHGVMLEAGFRESELNELYVRATAHVDDVGADFVPDMDILEAEPETFSVAVGAAEPVEVEDAVSETEAMEAAPAEAVVDAEIPVAVVKDLVDEVEPTVVEDAPEDLPADDEQPDDDPGVTQLSLF